jgi:hypothetical protein
MPMTPQQVQALVEANAVALGLHLAAEHKPGVLGYFALAAGMAELVYGLPLTIDDEPGDVFTPIAPEGGA